MTVSVATADESKSRRLMVQAPLLVGGLAFLWLFWEPFVTLLRDWWSDPEAGHGLLLGPLSVYLMYRSGLIPERKAQPVLGLLLLAAAVLLRILSALAAELFTMRMSLLGAAIALIIYAWGFRQVLKWWLPLALLALSVPLPAVILTTLAFPLQLKASAIGATLLQWRDVPVQLAGNVIHLPGQSLFVTEACSGLRSLTALTSLGLLMGGMWLRFPAVRVLLLVLTIPVAILINGVRVFLTGFLVFFVNPALGEGFMHLTEGWVMFIAAFAILGLITWLLARGEGWVRPVRPAVEAT
jgi:exosortase